MLFSTSAIGIFGIISATASPFRRDNAPVVHCGTAGDAVLSQCQELLSPEVWGKSLYNNDETYSFVEDGTLRKIQFTGTKANKVACIAGCCVYATAGGGSYVDDDREVIRQQALSLLGCVSEGKKTGIMNVNAMGNFGGQSVCVASVDSGKDCFEDKDFAPKKGSWNYPVKAEWNPKKGPNSSTSSTSIARPSVTGALPSNSASTWGVGSSASTTAAGASVSAI